MAIAHQPATTVPRRTARPSAGQRLRERGRGGRLVPVNQSTRTWTVTKLGGLVAVTALAFAFVTALVVGAALFALMNLGS